ncbi:endoribonuclease YbeY isoform X3 [Lacerta agilis]|uniref:endoribonuclease YbeY isoform X3 n=1 Tax=Lacerta agilis TaxID=80427 RepID=UPI001419AFE7|nr:endoribonuclease YbeY isoform X3 [Lacerta agilis]
MAEAPPYRKSEPLELPEGEAGARLPSCPGILSEGRRFPSRGRRSGRGKVPNLTAGELPQPCARGDYNLGDIFLGVEHIYQECEENKEDFYSILTVTIAHGMCHLLGYKHSTEAEWQQMYEKEAQILLELNRLSDTNLQPLTKHHF